MDYTVMAAAIPAVLVLLKLFAVKSDNNIDNTIVTFLEMMWKGSKQIEK